MERLSTLLILGFIWVLLIIGVVDASDEVHKEVKNKFIISVPPLQKVPNIINTDIIYMKQCSLPVGALGKELKSDNNNLSPQELNNKYYSSGAQYVTADGERKNIWTAEQIEVFEKFNPDPYNPEKYKWVKGLKRLIPYCSETHPEIQTEIELIHDFAEVEKYRYFYPVRDELPFYKLCGLIYDLEANIRTLDFYCDFYPKFVEVMKEAQKAYQAYEEKCGWNKVGTEYYSSFTSGEAWSNYYYATADKSFKEEAAKLNTKLPIDSNLIRDINHFQLNPTSLQVLLIIKRAERKDKFLAVLKESRNNLNTLYSSLINTNNSTNTDNQALKAANKIVTWIRDDRHSNVQNTRDSTVKIIPVTVNKLYSSDTSKSHSIVSATDEILYDYYVFNQEHSTLEYSGIKVDFGTHESPEEILIDPTKIIHYMHTQKWKLALESVHERLMEWHASRGTYKREIVWKSFFKSKNKKEVERQGTDLGNSLYILDSNEQPLYKDYRLLENKQVIDCWQGYKDMRKEQVSPANVPTIENMYEEYNDLTKTYKQKYVSYKTIVDNLNKLMKFCYEKNMVNDLFPAYDITTLQPKISDNSCSLDSKAIKDKHLNPKSSKSWTFNKTEDKWVYKIIEPSLLMQNIESLDLAFNQLMGWSVMEQMNAAYKLPVSSETLTNLNLSNNEIVNIFFIEDLKNLKLLNLSKNKILEIKIPHTWKQLIELDVSDNQLESIVFEKGPECYISFGDKTDSSKDINSSSYFPWLWPTTSTPTIQEKVCFSHKALKVLELSNNQIDVNKLSKRETWNLYLADNLEELDLSNNGNEDINNGTQKYIRSTFKSLKKLNNQDMVRMNLPKNTHGYNLQDLKK